MKKYIQGVQNSNNQFVATTTKPVRLDRRRWLRIRFVSLIGFIASLASFAYGTVLVINALRGKTIVLGSAIYKCISRLNPLRLARPSAYKIGDAPLCQIGVIGTLERF